MQKRFLAIVFFLLFTSLPSLASAGAASAEKFYQQGMERGNSGDLDGAKKLFRQAIAADPTHFLAFFDLGGALESSRDFDGAIDHYVKTIELKPNFAEANNQLATLYLLHRHDHDRAIQFFNRALEEKDPYIDPRFSLRHTRSQATLNLSVAYASKGDYRKAIEIAKDYLKNKDLDRSNDSKLQTLIERANADLKRGK